MARKEPPRPLFDLKGDFQESLDRALHHTINLMQAVEQAIDLEQIKPGPVLELLRERTKLMRTALMSEN